MGFFGIVSVFHTYNRQMADDASGSNTDLICRRLCGDRGKSTLHEDRGRQQRAAGQLFPADAVYSQMRVDATYSAMMTSSAFAGSFGGASRARVPSRYNGLQTHACRRCKSLRKSQNAYEYELSCHQCSISLTPYQRL